MGFLLKVSTNKVSPGIFETKTLFGFKWYNQVYQNFKNSTSIFFLKTEHLPGMLGHAFIFNIQEAEVGGSLSSETA